MKVRFTEEIVLPKMETKVYVPPVEVSPWPNEWKTTYWSNSNDYARDVKCFHSSGGLSGSIIPASNVEGGAGATVEGSESRQSFGYTSWGINGRSETLSVRLRAGKRPVLVSDTRYKYCPECGRRSKRGNRYCPHCGNRLD